MGYIEKINNKLTCNHPKVSKIHEWGGAGLDPFSMAYRFITLTMSDGEEKVFQDYGEGKAEEEAEQYLQSFDILTTESILERVKEITPQKYAKWYGCRVQYIHRLLQEGRIELLPNVLRVKKYSRFYVLEVPVDMSKDSFKEILPPKDKA